MTPLALNYTDTGTGEPLLIVHGLFGSAKNWGAIIKKLAVTRRVIAVDLRNHGDSPWSDDVSYDALAGDLVALMERLGLASAHVLGHSMGGKAVMTLALTRPEMVKSLIVSDIAPVNYKPGFDAYIDAMRAVDAAAVSRRAEADAALADAIPEPGIRAFLLQSLVVGERWKLNLPALKAGLVEISAWTDPTAGAPYDGPVLFTAGANSKYIQMKDREPIKALFPKAHIAKVKNAGHWIHAEQPVAFLSLVEAFLQSLDS